MEENQVITGPTDHVTLKVSLHNYRYPRDKVHVSGDFAIVLFHVVKEIDGVIDPSSYTQYGINTIIVRGNMPRIDENVEYVLDAKRDNDPKWGVQYVCENIRMDYNMENEEDQKKFLSYFLTDRQIESLFSSYPNPIKLLEQNDIPALTTIKGIGPVIAARMCTKYAENITNSRAYIELKGLGLTKYAIDKLIKQFGSADMVVEIINANPYSLINLVRGYGWEKADKIALNQGFSRACKERCIAYAQYRLEKYAEEGNSCMSIGELMDDVMQMCAPVTKEVLAVFLKEEMIGQSDFDELYERIKDGEKITKFPIFFYSSELKKVGLFYYRLLERKILSNLRRLSELGDPFDYDPEVCEEIIKKTEEEQGFTYTDEQRKAIYSILDNNVSILTGSSGTGKSSTVKPLIKIFEHYHKEVSQCALSGRAASLLTGYTGLEGKTIHRLLGYIAEEERFRYTENSPIPTDVVILDETSMVGEELFLCLIQAIRTGAKLIMLGDIQQLPPMSVGNLLSDFITSGYIKANMLRTIHRQALLSGIISESIHVCQGKSLCKTTFSGAELRGSLKDFYLISYADSNVVHTEAINEFKRLLDQGIPADDIQVIVPVRTRGINSCRFFNAEIQNLVNPRKDKELIIDVTDAGTTYKVAYRPGDKIMVIKNNYHVRTTKGTEVAVFNGNMGYIKDIGHDIMIVEIEDVGEIFLKKDEWNNITHGWACTCHKCVTGDTLIYTNKGLKRIGELYNGAEIGEQRLLDSDILVFNGEYYEKPSHFYNAGLSPIVKIKTKYNYQLKCTLDHKVKVQRNGEAVMIPSSELREGDLLYFATNFQSNFIEDLLQKWQERHLDVRSVLYHRPDKMTPDFALFLGMMVADGTLRRRGFHYYKKDIETVKVFQSLVKKLFNYDAEIRKHGKNTNAWGVECSSTDISQFLLNIDGLEPYNKHIPSCIFMSSTECQQKFLQGIFEDGGIHMKKGNFDMIELACKEKRCSEEIRMLLLQQGITSSMYHYYENKVSQKTGKKLDSYKIMIYSNSAKRFKEKINFLDKEKSRKLDLVLQHPEYSHLDNNPVSDDQNFILLPVVEIKEDFDYTYCLTMPEAHLFVQNGIIGSNCQGSGFPYVITCVDSSAYVLLTREWLYTAITRAKRFCSLVGQPKAINAACHNSNVKVKQTWLKGDLRDLAIERSKQQ